MPSTEPELVKAAFAARRAAYAPYSGFLVGAALQVESGEIFVGCNVENASYGLTVCAERVAVGSAIASGQRRWARLAIVSDGRVPPCGACRQVLAEFAPSLTLVLVDSRQPDQTLEVTLAELFPQPFRPIRPPIV